MYIVSDKTTVATYPNRIRAQPFTKRHHCQWLPCMHYLQAEFLILTCYQQLHDRSSLTEDCKCLQEAPAPPVQQSTLHPSQTKQRDLQLLKSFRVPEKKIVYCLPHFDCSTTQNDRKAFLLVFFNKLGQFNHEVGDGNLVPLLAFPGTNS